MNARDIIKEFLNENILLTPDEFSSINKENYREILKKKLKEKNQTKEKANIIKEKKKEGTQEKKQLGKTNNSLKYNNPSQNTLESLANGNIHVDFVPNISKRSGSLSVVDVSSIYSDKLNTLKKIFPKQLNPVSINKIRDSPEEIHIIGIVNELNNNGFTLEDETGLVTVVNQTPIKVSEDDVVGVIGKTRNGIVHAERILTTDIPLDNKHNVIDVRISFNFSESDIVKIENFEKKIDDVQMIIINKGDLKMNILFYKTTQEIKTDDAVEMLKRRCIQIEKGVVPHFYPFKEIPDFFIVSSPNSEPSRSNYKDIRIIITGEKGEIITKND